jgi:lipopolysaccharide biosynthesis regulator YciM
MQLPDVPYIEILIILVAFIILGIILISVFRKKKQSEHSNAYLEALELFADGKAQEAQEKLKEAIKQNTGNVKAYLRLGDQLREQGLVKNAMRIHKELTLRENLSKTQNIQIQKSLLLDYEAVHDYENGIIIARKILDFDKSKDFWVINKLIRLYENNQNWQEAVNTSKRYYRPLSEEKKRKIASYYISQGMATLNNGKGKEARVKFKEAIKMDPRCSEAYLQIGKSYLNENRPEDAISIWRKFCFEAPDQAHIVFPFLEKASFETGEFSDIENLYTELLNLDIKNKNTLLALVELYIKKGSYEKALSTLEDADSQFRDIPEIPAKKVEVLHRINRYEDASAIAVEFFKKQYQTLDHPQKY